MNMLKKLFFPALFFLLGILFSSGARYVLAHGGDLNLIHACVRTSNGSIRIVGANDVCNNNETALDWSQNGVGNFGGFTTNQLIGYTDTSLAFNYRNFSGANFTNAYLVNGNILNSDFSNTNFSNSQLLSGVIITSSDFSNANFTNASVDVFFDQIDFTDANFTGTNFSPEGSSTDFLNSNLTNVNLTNADLTGVTNLSTSTRTGVIWFNTICPDGTNSDSNGNTCEGHLTP